VFFKGFGAKFYIEDVEHFFNGTFQPAIYGNYTPALT